MSFSIYISYIFLLVFQPGVFWQDITKLRIVLLVGILCIFTFLLNFLQKKPVKFLDPIGKSLLVFIVIQVISNLSVWLIYAYDTFYLWISIATVYFVGVLYLDRISKAKKFVWAFIFPGIFFGFYGIYNYSKIKEIITHENIRTGAYGMYANPNDLSHLMIMIFPFVFKAFETRKNLLVRLILVISMGGILYASYLTASRGGLLGMIIVVFLSILSSKSFKPIQKRTLLVVMLLLAATVIPAKIMKRAEYSGGKSLFDISDDSIEGRRDVWWEARQIIKEHPLMGIGDGQFQEYLPRDAHSIYYVIATEKGIPGIMTFFILIYFCFKNLFKARILKDSQKGSEDFDILLLAQATGISIIGHLFHGLFANKEKEVIFFICVTLCSVIANLVDKAVEKRKSVKETK
jgi:putative inorganic carbon (hco3(-)) transporter